MKSDPKTLLPVSLFIVVLLVISSACGVRPVTPPVIMPVAECVILSGGEEEFDSITVALLDEIHPEHAPFPCNAGEQMLFTHLYEALVNIDCRGEVHSRLVQSWSRGDGDRRWTFELRQGERFWDGTPVTGGDIARNWGPALSDTEASSAGIDSVTAEGDQILHIYFDHPRRDAYRMFASIDFAVSKRIPGSQWPLGTGPYEVAPLERWGESVSTSKMSIRPAFDMEGPIIQFVDASRQDRRDLLDGVVDMMITADPAVIEYADSREELTTISLSWDRTYVLFSTSRVQELRRGGTAGELPSDLLEDFARDAVRGDARGHKPPVWWEDLHTCGELIAAADQIPPLPIGAYGTSGRHRILYDVKDEVARGLTERIVALTTTELGTSSGAMALVSTVPGLVREDSRVSAEGVTGSELEKSLQNGDGFAYVIPIPLRATDPCLEAGRLLKMAPWLAIDEVDLSTVIVPLVDTRHHVIARRNGVELSVDWNGNIFIATGGSREK